MPKNSLTGEWGLESINEMFSQTRKVALHELDHPPSDLLERMLRRLLSLNASQLAIAELIDDMPIRDHYSVHTEGHTHHI